MPLPLKNVDVVSFFLPSVSLAPSLFSLSLSLFLFFFPCYFFSRRTAGAAVRGALVSSANMRVGVLRAVANWLVPQRVQWVAACRAACELRIRARRPASGVRRFYPPTSADAISTP